MALAWAEFLTGMPENRSPQNTKRHSAGAVAAATVITAAAAAAVAASASAATGSVLQAQRVQKSASVGKKAAASSTSSSSENMLARLIKNAPDVAEAPAQPSPKASHSWLEEQVRLFLPSLRSRAGTLNSAQFSGD